MLSTIKNTPPLFLLLATLLCGNQVINASESIEMQSASSYFASVRVSP